MEDTAELFEVGDKVRVVDPDDGVGVGKFPIGTIGVIIKKHPNCYRVDANGDHWYYSDHELEAA